MRGVIRLGDPASHGGKVVSTGSLVKVKGIPAAPAYGKCSCKASPMARPNN